MGEMMEFPKTIKEFIDDYKFKDTKEIYTNGSELIQVYRVEQALEHYDIAKLEKEIELYKKALDKAIEKITREITSKSDDKLTQKELTLLRLGWKCYLLKESEKQ